MKAVNVDDVLRILDKYGRYIFVTDEKKYSSMVDEIANLKALEQEPKWIPVSKRLPKEEINPITHDFYEYQCTYHAHGVYDVRSYKYGNGHWWHGAGIMDDYVLAWRENLEPYEAESEEV